MKSRDVFVLGVSCVLLTQLAACGNACLDDGVVWGQDPEQCEPLEGDTESNTDTQTSNTTTPTTETTDPSTSEGPGSDSEGLMTYCVDEDGDGFGDPDNCMDANEPPGDGWAPNGDDCNDQDPNTFPGAAENEENSEACMTDADGDGWGDIDPLPGVEPGTDCNDANEFAFPGAAPNDDPNACMEDKDDDDWGDVDPDPGAEPGTDCDDLDAFTFPGAAELEDGMSCMKDADDDGFGDADPGPGVEPGQDCDDNNAFTFPGAAPNDDPVACMKDEDEDDWGDDMPPEGVTPGTDCDDNNQFAFPGAAEIEAPDQCMEDEDDDGWGDAMPDGPNTTPGTDCDDTNPFAFPGAAPNDDPLACMEDEDGDDWGDLNPPDGVTPGSDCADDDPNVYTDCEPCDPMSQMCVGQELWTCNDNGNAYIKELCDYGCDPIQLICVDELTLEAGPSVCIDNPGDMVQLDAMAMGGDGNYMWDWQPPDFLNNPNIGDPIASPTMQTNYTVTVQDGLNNMAQDSLSVFIKDTPLPLSDQECAITGFGWGGGNINWNWDPNESELCQVVNSDPTARFCGWSLDDAQLQGLFQVKTTSDNDYVGFLFGLQPFDVGNEDPAQFYFFSWKQGNQVPFCGPNTGAAGMLIKRIDVTDPMNTPLSCRDMHANVDTANSVVLATEADMGAGGWADNTEYIFDLTHEPNQFTVRIINSGNMAVVAEQTFMDNTYPNGAVGFYAYSQTQACYKQFTTSCL